MKKLFQLMAVLCLYLPMHTQTKLPDGFYTLAQSGNESTVFDSLNAGRALIKFNAQFLENAPEGVDRVSVYTNDYVPLELEKQPRVSKQNNKPALNISMSHGSASRLETFTKARVMKQVVILFEGEALSMHKIRETIMGGHLQITGCSDHACEQLLVKMKDKVKAR